jgi:F0F1-type ATP synthase alpha subunit
VKGYLDDVLTKEIGRFEELFLKFMKDSHMDLMNEIKKTGILTPD